MSVKDLTKIEDLIATWLEDFEDGVPYGGTARLHEALHLVQELILA